MHKSIRTLKYYPPWIQVYVLPEEQARVVGLNVVQGQLDLLALLGFKPTPPRD